MLAGDERTSDERSWPGPEGFVPVWPNYDPGLFLRLFDAGSRGDREQLARVMDELRELHEADPVQPLLARGNQYALAALGIGSGRLLSPLPQADCASDGQDRRPRRARPRGVGREHEMPGDEGV